MLDLDALERAALARLKHSVGTSAGMHKRQIRRKAERMREELLPVTPPLSADQTALLVEQQRLIAQLLAGQNDISAPYRAGVGARNMLATHPGWH